MILKEFNEFFNDSAKFSGNVKFNEPLKTKTTMQVGGNADIFIEPFDEKSLVYAVKILKENNCRFFVLGGGSNVIIDDKGLDAVISVRKIKFLSIMDSNNDENEDENKTEKLLAVGAGESFGNIISFCRKNNKGGLEAFSGLSGTAGGAAFMNASCFGKSISDCLCKAVYLDLLDLCVKEYVFDEKDWNYKKSFFNTWRGGVAGPFQWCPQ